MPMESGEVFLGIVSDPWASENWFRFHVVHPSLQMQKGLGS